MSDAAVASNSDASTSVEHLQGGFIHTAVVTISCNGRRLTARAAMVSCATHSLMTEEVAAFLQPARQSVELTMQGAVSQQKLKHWVTVTISTATPSEVAIPLRVAITPELPKATPPENPSEIANNNATRTPTG